MKNLILIILSLMLGILMLLGCSTECPEGICTPKLLWAQLLDEGNLNTTFIPVIYKNKALYGRNIPTGVSDKTRIRFLDKENGNLISEWDDMILDFDKIEQNALKHIYDESKLVFGNAARIYEVDMETEKTIYKYYEKDNCGLSNVTGVGNIVYQYQSDCTKGTGEKFIVEYNLATQTRRILYTIGNEGIDVFNYIKTPIPYIDKEGETILIFNIAHFDQNTNNTDGRLIAYNVTKKKELYNEQLSVDNYAGFPAAPILNNGKVYMPFGNSIYCHDQYTGKQLWRKFFPHDFLSSDPIIAEGKLYAACENKRLFCLNLDTGDIIWETDGAGTPSNLVYMNGVIYFVGGSDGKLHAVDAVTGSHIWRFASPDLAKNEDAFFQKAIVADPSTNRIYTATYLNAMCFKAAR
jgi:outer membrane protein assembly factor BamB